MRRIAGALLPESAKGAIEYYLRPALRNGFGGPFNGQAERRKIFNCLMRVSTAGAIIETGSYRGTTTEILAQYGVPVITIEGVARNFGFTWARMRDKSHVRVLKGDSRNHLRRILAQSTACNLKRPIAFYLDAHWYEDLPLAEELDIIFSAELSAVVMIDDFEVPGDAGYGFDNYGEGKALRHSYIAPAIERFGLTALYPAAPSASETGHKRGSVLLLKPGSVVGSLLQSGLVRATDPIMLQNASAAPR
jgi:hypothetical protein